MKNDIRVYGYDDNEPLITRTTQIKKYIDSKLGQISAPDMSSVEDKLESIQETMNTQFAESTETIIESMNDIHECTEKNMQHMTHHVIDHIKHAECHILDELEDVFIDLNKTLNSNKDEENK